MNQSCEDLMRLLYGNALLYVVFILCFLLECLNHLRIENSACMVRFGSHAEIHCDVVGTSVPCLFNSWLELLDCELIW